MDKPQYATIGNRSVKSLSGIGAISGGRRWSSYKGRDGRVPSYGIVKLAMAKEMCILVGSPLILVRLFPNVEDPGK